MIISRKLILLILAIGLSATILSHAQTSTFNNTITISEVKPIAENPPFPLVESFLAINPTNPQNMLATAMSPTTDSSVVYNTWDGGFTWQKVQNGNEGIFPGGDPMIAFDGNGQAYFSTITPGTTVWRSVDGGHTWSDSTKIEEPGKAHDRQWIAASRKSAGNEIPVYATAKTVNDQGQHILITTRSVDGGTYFSKPQAIPVDNGYLHAPSDLLVRDNGTILLSYLVYYGYQSSELGIVRGERLLLVSKNNGQTWSGPHSIGKKLTYGNRVQDQSLVSKGLESPALAVDQSGGKFDGSIYTTWTTIIDGHLQVVAAYSRDGGHTWGDPVQVNQGGFNSNHSTTMAAVNKNGVVAVTWNDRRNDSNDTCFQHYIAISRDGGQSFSTNKQISNRKTCPNQERWANGGDTQGLVALPNGNFRVTWPLENNDSLTVWTAVARISPNNK